MGTVLDAFRGYKQNIKVLLYGIGKFSRYEKLLAVESIEYINILDPLDIPSRIEEFRSLKDGWLNGEKGLIPSEEDLSWFSGCLRVIFCRRPDIAISFPYTRRWTTAGVDYR